MSLFHETERDAILLHTFFGVIVVLTLFISSGLSIGQRLCALVIVYNIMVPVVALLRRHHDWLAIWLFVFPLSLLQIFPDLFLSSVLGVIVFPDTGSPRVGDVPLFMGGLWIIPLFIIVLLGRRVQVRFTKNLAILAVCIASAVLFLGSEAVLWLIPIWYAHGVTVIAHVAIYLIVPEILLGLFTFLAFETFHIDMIWYRLGAAFTVMVIYLGNLCFFYLIIEHLIFRFFH
jgi:hypothetical protein